MAVTTIRKHTEVINNYLNKQYMQGQSLKDCEMIKIVLIGIVLGVAREPKEIIEDTTHIGSESLYSRTLNIRNRIEKRMYSTRGHKNNWPRGIRIINSRMNEAGGKE